uniref:Receptor-like serine/threonine-protein kinase n=1 Tax=Salix viminalis TaxID=40686 RepID=A0A6N2LA58_SALVM
MATVFFLISIYLFFSAEISQSLQSNITKGSTLFTNSTPNFWLSPSGHFAFGFYPSGNGFKVGTWLIGRPRNTVVWTALRDEPALLPGVSLVFTTDGRLLVLNFTAVQLIAQTNQKAQVAAMHDSGNFLLYGSNMEVVWATFRFPTNTLLVTQELGPDKILYSSKSDTDDSAGDFKLWMQIDGNLVAYQSKSLQVVKYSYWSSQSKSNTRGVSLTFAADSRLYLVNSTGFSIRNLTGGTLPVNTTTLYRATFDVDGVLRLYQHQMGTDGSLNSIVLWSAINREDRCSVKGACGLNSYCDRNGADNIACLCPPGFDFADPNQPNKGCKLNSSVDNDCFLKGANDDYMISTLENTIWERDEYEVLTPVSEEACSKACLEDCYCVVAMFKDQVCFKPKLPLRNGIKNSSSPSTSFVKVRITNTKNIITKKLGKELLITGVVLIAFSLVILASSGYLIYTHQIWSLKVMTRKDCPPDVLRDINLTSFSYDQLAVATNDFMEEIGKGASGKVYKGSVPENGGKEIAVKRLEKLVEDGEREFQNEMKIIGRTHHKNLVRLIGFCCEGSNRLLVYELMKNGSLGNLIFKNKKPPSWEVRTRIALEVAKGLHYLHEECETRIIHCDIKPHNVLMDESLSAKISDFGLSKLLKPDQTRTYTIPRGTRGYEAPEWHRHNTPVTTKADVFSFGILLLEIVSCRKNVDLLAPDDEIILMDWVQGCYGAGELKKVVGEVEVNLEELEKMVKIGLWCVQTEIDLRPTMKQVILMMDGTIVTPPPPPPNPAANN